MLTLQDHSRMALLKERFCFFANDTYFVVDFFFNIKEGLPLVKVRSNNDLPVVFPSFLPVAREVTDEKGYSSKTLAKKNWYAPSEDEPIINFRKESL